MDYFMCSLVVVICLSATVSSQLAPKPIGEWSPLRAEMYPNPWVNSTLCKTKALSGLCDYNEILTVEERDSFGEEPEIKTIGNADGCLCSKTCGAPLRIKVTVAIMKKIGPEISDYRVAAMDFAREFRKLWNLQECTVILVASRGDNMGYADPGSNVNNRTGCSVNVTDKIDQNIYETYFKNGHFVQGINATLLAYRNCTATTTEGTDGSSNTGHIIAGVIVAVIVVVIIIIIVFVVIRRRRESRKL